MVLIAFPVYGKSGLWARNFRWRAARRRRRRMDPVARRGRDGQECPSYGNHAYGNHAYGNHAYGNHAYGNHAYGKKGAQRTSRQMSARAMPSPRSVRDSSDLPSPGPAPRNHKPCRAVMVQARANRAHTAV
jgi:hypothetical protein